MTTVNIDDLLKSLIDYTNSTYGEITTAINEARTTVKGLESRRDELQANNSHAVNDIKEELNIEQEIKAQRTALHRLEREYEQLRQTSDNHKVFTEFSDALHNRVTEAVADTDKAIKETAAQLVSLLESRNNTVNSAYAQAERGWSRPAHIAGYPRYGQPAYEANKHDIAQIEELKRMFGLLA